MLVGKTVHRGELGMHREPAGRPNSRELGFLGIIKVLNKSESYKVRNLLQSRSSGSLGVKEGGTRPSKIHSKICPETWWRWRMTFKNVQCVIKVLYLLKRF